MNDLVFIDPDLENRILAADVILTDEPNRKSRTLWVRPTAELKARGPVINPRVLILAISSDDEFRMAADAVDQVKRRGT